tara:strand:- start:490 stop:654 length:165 start_codon:yes stop_codon:yes gene_type:complete
MEQYGVIMVMRKSLAQQSFTLSEQEWFCLTVEFSTMDKPTERKLLEQSAKVLSG